MKHAIFQHPVDYFWLLLNQCIVVWYCIMVINRYSMYFKYFWSRSNSQFPRLLTFWTALPRAAKTMNVLIICGWTTSCPGSCSCYKKGILCTARCRCSGHCYGPPILLLRSVVMYHVQPSQYWTQHPNLLWYTLVIIVLHIHTRAGTWSSCNDPVAFKLTMVIPDSVWRHFGCDLQQSCWL